MQRWKTLLFSVMALPGLAGAHQTPVQHLSGIPLVPVASSLLRWEGNANPDEAVYDPEIAWQKLRQPYRGTRAHGIAALRSAVRRSGITTVLPYKKPDSPAALAALEFLYGTSLVFAGDLPDHAPIIRMASVVLHPGNSAQTANRVRGEINPHLGYDRLHGSLDKWREFQFAESTHAGVMPTTWLASSHPFWDKGSHREQAAHLRLTLDLTLKHHQMLSSAQGEELQSFVQQFLHASGEGLPHGAFIKHRLACDTYGTGRLITSKGSDSGALVQEFISDLGKFLSTLPADKPVTEEDLATYLLVEGSQWSLFVADLFFRPERIIVQEAIVIARTPRNVPMEFRVDFIDGEPLLTCARHSLEYLPEEMQRASTIIREFFAKAQPQYRYLSGGADVAITEDSGPRIIEFNFGAESGFMNLGIAANTYASKLLGHPTPLLKLLHKIVSAPLPEQQALLREVNHSVLAHPEVDRVQEVYAWVRDRYLEAWSKQPSAEGAKRTLKRIHDLFALAPASLSETIKEMYDDARHFIKGKQL
jgi:hypothetical protein